MSCYAAMLLPIIAIFRAGADALPRMMGVDMFDTSLDADDVALMPLPDSHV